MADEGQVQECKAMLKHSWALNLSFNYYNTNLFKVGLQIHQAKTIQH